MGEAGWEREAAGWRVGGTAGGSVRAGACGGVRALQGLLCADAEACWCADVLKRQFGIDVLVRMCVGGWLTACFLIPHAPPLPRGSLGVSTSGSAGRSIDRRSDRCRCAAWKGLRGMALAVGAEWDESPDPALRMDEVVTLHFESCVALSVQYLSTCSGRYEATRVISQCQTIQCALHR